VIERFGVRRSLHQEVADASKGQFAGVLA